MRTAPFASRRPVPAAVLVAAIVGTAAACGTVVSGTTPGSAYSMTPAAPARTATATAPPGPLAGLTADQIAARAVADFRTVSSVRVTGSVTDSGGNIALNLAFGPKGCTGTLGVRGEGSMRLLKIGKTLWVKPDSQFWRYAAGKNATPEFLRLVAGKYLKPGAKDSSLRSVGDLCSRSQFAGHLGGQITGLVKGATTTISGQPALQLKNAGDSTSAYVTVSAHPELLRLDGGSQGRLDFSGYDMPLMLTPPPASQTLDGATYGF